MTKIFDEIAEERKDQDEQWGGPEHDDQHEFFDFNRYIRKQGCSLDHCEEVETNSIETNRLMARKHFIKIAALAVAAVESIDRKT